MPRQNARRLTIPDDVEARADAALAEEKERRRQARKADERDFRCREAVAAYCRATEALWLAKLFRPFDPHPHQKAIHNSLLKACVSLRGTGRLAAWEQTDHERTYNDFRQVNHREMTRPSYDWACEMFDRAGKGELPEALVVQTWDTESLRDALRWLRVFLCELSGEGAVLPTRTQEQPKTAAERPTIFWLGDRTYRVGQSDPVLVGDAQDALLQAFLGASVLDKPRLAKRSGLAARRVIQVMQGLRKKHNGLFEAAIHCPGRRGHGGYRATVIDARPERAAEHDT